MSRKIPLAQYLFSRLNQLGCHSIHGVPGDFFLRALDHLPASKVRWIGNANELCAGYAADGYARAAATARRARVDGQSIPRVGALFTTYGVGELSAINAIAGSHAESVPVVHFVGTPSRKAWKERPIIHHSLADRDLGIYAEVAKKFSCAQADLNCETAEEAVERYDHALEKCVQLSQPIYVNLPNDMTSKEVSKSLLERQLDMSLHTRLRPEDSKVVDLILQRILFAKKPLIIADGFAYSWDLLDEVNELARLTNIPTTCFNAGKGVANEDLPSWIGPLTAPTEYSRSTDMALLIGPLLSDTNTAAWITVPDPEVSISIELDNVKIGQEVLDASGKEVLRGLIDRLRTESDFTQGTYLSTSVKNTRSTPSVPSPSFSIGQDAFWQRIASWLAPHDTLLLANGTPLVGGREIHLPSPVQVFASGIWNSIGQMLPAAQGIAAAKQDHNLLGRTILFEGDGSFQVTCQAVSDIIRYKLDVTIFIINNAGYTYERLLHGLEADYNDVPTWRYVDAARFFGAEKQEGYSTMSRRVENWGELEEVLADSTFADGRGLKIIDVVMDPGDVPESSRAGLKRASQAIKTI
jgi:pyruvate decarboxylase